MSDARAANYPLSRWYLRPLAGWLAEWVGRRGVRPWQLTCCGLACGMAAALWVFVERGGSPLAGLLVLAAWFFDRADGQLARLSLDVSAFGAWLDANVDELVDIALHLAIAAAAARSVPALAAPLAMAFLAGKYLFMYGLSTEQWAQGGASRAAASFSESAGPDSPPREQALPSPQRRWGADLRPTQIEPPLSRGRQTLVLLRRAYHGLGNADVRAHLAALAVGTGYLTTELALVALYYNFRWMIRYPLVLRRLTEGAP